MKRTNVAPLSVSSLLLSLFAVAASGLLSGCASAPEAPLMAQETGIEKSAWINNLHESLAQELCNPDQIFRSCFAISDNDCFGYVKESAATCETKYDPLLPEVVSDSQGQRWGGRIGKCTGETLFRNLEDSHPLMTANAACASTLGDL